MHDQLRQSIRSPNGCRDPLLAAVVSKSPQNPGVAVRRLKGDEFVPKVVVIKKIPKLPQAFI